MLPNLDIFRHDSYTYFYQLHKGDYLMKKILEEFKAFALKGNMIDMAVAVIIGGAFNGLITCPYCKTKIAIAATRCPHCTSILSDEIQKEAAAALTEK